LSPSEQQEDHDKAKKQYQLHGCAYLKIRRGSLKKSSRTVLYLMISDFLVEEFRPVGARGGAKTTVFLFEINTLPLFIFFQGRCSYQVISGASTSSNPSQSQQKSSDFCAKSYSCGGYIPPCG